MRSSNSRIGVQPAPNDADREAIRNTVIAFAVTLQVIFVGNTETLGVVGMLVTLVAIAAWDWRAFYLHMVGRPLPHIFWALALASILWSIEPAVTARYGVQLALSTFLGMLMTGYGRGRGAIQGVALAFPIFLLASIFAGHSVAMGASGGTAFSGLTGSKNLLAGTAAFGLIAMLAAAADSFERRKPQNALFFLGGAALAFYVVLLARSSGAIVTLALMTPVLVFMLAVRRAQPSVRSVTLILVLLFAALILVFLQPLTDFATDVVLRAFNKDPTLTGRTYLWQRADDVIRQRPWLGLGYNAFWVQGHVDAEGLWRWAGISGRLGFNFHSTLRETLVSFGWVGFTILSTALLACLALFARLFVIGANAGQIFWFTILVFMLTSVGWESFLPMPFSMSSFFIFGAFCAACSPTRAVTARVGYRRNVRQRAQTA